MIERDQRFKLAPNVVSEFFDAEAILVQMNTEVIFATNETGTQILELIVKESLLQKLSVF